MGIHTKRKSFLRSGCQKNRTEKKGQISKYVMAAIAINAAKNGEANADDIADKTIS